MTDLWQNLQSSSKPLVLYGTGNGADRIIDELEKRKIGISGVFASDGFVRNRSFRNFKVESYRDITARLGNEITVLIAFGSSLPHMLERFAALAAKHEIYVPDVPVCGGELFDADFYTMHRKELSQAREALYDAESKTVFDNIVDCRLSGRIDLLYNLTSDTSEIMRTILNPENYRVTVDAGAYTGDTAEELIGFAENIDTVIAIEPDGHNLTKLCARAALNSVIEPVYAAAWDRFDVLEFTKGGGRGIRRGKSKTVDVSARPIDAICGNRDVDFIKYDVEGCEMKALAGSEKTISACMPELQIALYHRSADLFEITNYIHAKYPEYKLFLRRNLSVPLWDINLFCVTRLKK